jgi:outer membrane protein OmpA-like peptidoglycan-associated protein
MRSLLYLFILSISVPVIAQTKEIQVSGKVISLSTGKAIKATIAYKSIPTGGISGRFMDSTYQFSVFGTARYQVTASAEGHLSRSIILDPKDMGSESVFVRNIELTNQKQTFRLNHLIFQLGKAVIDPQSFPELDELAALMEDSKNMIIQLEGHTDNVGDAKMNMKLSEDRVDAVKSYLASKGISKSRMKTKAFGGTRPLSGDGTPEARALNRRVEIRVLSQ